MKKYTVIIVSVILLVVSCVALVYGGPRADISDRIAEQQQRIDQGIASGALNRGEADVVQDNLNWIRATFARMKADGRLNPGEVNKLEGMLEQNSQMIFNKKHNPIKRVYQAGIPDRIADQKWRIEQGISSGALTRREADVLQDNLDWIKTTFARMKADGRLNQREIGKLETMLDENNRMIFNKKHNPIKRAY